MTLYRTTISLYCIQYIKSVKSLARGRLLFDHPSRTITTRRFRRALIAVATTKTFGLRSTNHVCVYPVHSSFVYTSSASEFGQRKVTRFSFPVFEDLLRETDEIGRPLLYASAAAAPLSSGLSPINRKRSNSIIRTFVEADSSPWVVSPSDAPNLTLTSCE